MTHIQYASDLHLEFPENREWLLTHPLEPVAEVLLLAGDIVPFPKLAAYKDFFRFVSKNWRAVYWVPGNHEYYGDDLSRRYGPLNESILPNVHLVNDTSITEGGTRLLCTTLWSAISQLNEYTVRQGMTDYRAIGYGNALLRPAHTTRLHESSLRWLKTELRKPTDAGQTVVVTHHVPTLMHYPEEFQRDALNEAFATELHDLIAGSDCSAWIYGHHHRNTPEFIIGRTRMLTNQLGYVRHGEHEAFATTCKL